MARRAALHDRIGYAFQDPTLLTLALTHPSAPGAGSAREHYQRLEFLGDRVLGLVVAGILYEAFPGAGEGELARRYNHLVRRDTCGAVALELGLDKALKAGAAETASRRSAILGDVCEAVIAAVYLDGGFEAARALIDRHWRPRMMAFSGPLNDAKTALQEWAQARGDPTPSYRLVDRSGPDHAPEFSVAVDVQGVACGEGRGRSKREAEQNAAAHVLVREGVWAAEGTGS